MLAAKAALAIRYDALAEDTNAEMGAENRAKLEARLRQLEERGVSVTHPVKSQNHTDMYVLARCSDQVLISVFRRSEESAEQAKQWRRPTSTSTRGE